MRHFSIEPQKAENPARDALIRCWAKLQVKDELLSRALYALSRWNRSGFCEHEAESLERAIDAEIGSDLRMSIYLADEEEAVREEA